MSELHSPLVEHPSGEFVDARAAIEEAFRVVSGPAYRDVSVLFTGQGRGATQDGYRFAEAVLSGGALQFNSRIHDASDIAISVGLSGSQIADNALGTQLVLGEATPKVLAAFLDRIYTERLGVRPFDGENDYQFGAELQ